MKIHVVVIPMLDVQLAHSRVGKATVTGTAITAAGQTIHGHSRLHQHIEQESAAGGHSFQATLQGRSQSL